MVIRLSTLTLLILVISTPARSQPALGSLWPNAGGNRWEYVFTVQDNDGDLDFSCPAVMEFDGLVVTAGGVAQILNAWHDPVPAEAALPDLPPLLRAVWRGRPDLRQALEANYGNLGDKKSAGSWWPLFIHGGYFTKSASSIQMWQLGWDHFTWTYVTSDLSVGSRFTQQLVPELASDVFLYATVGDVDATISTNAGVFQHAVRLDYLIDTGISTATDENGVAVGVFHSESHGHVTYVPHVGPVEMLDEFMPFVWLDCYGDCPPEWEDLVGVVNQRITLSLAGSHVSSQVCSWGAIKALYP